LYKNIDKLEEIVFP